jgi:GT2 family glycosyltransferase
MRFVAEHYQFGFERIDDPDDLRARYCIFANLSMDRQAFLDQGGFDEGLSFFEDQDLGIRLERAGRRLVFSREAVCWHHCDSTLRGYCRRQERIGPSALEFARRHPDRPEVTRLSGLSRYRMKRLLLNALAEPGWRFLAGLLSSLGLKRPAEAMYFQILSYHYYRGVARALREPQF